MNKNNLYKNLLEQPTTLFRAEYITNPLGLREIHVFSSALSMNPSLDYNSSAIADSLEQLARMIRENREVALFVNGRGLTLEKRFSQGQKRSDYKY